MGMNEESIGNGVDEATPTERTDDSLFLARKEQTNFAPILKLSLLRRAGLGFQETLVSAPVTECFWDYSHFVSQLFPRPFFPVDVLFRQL